MRNRDRNPEEKKIFLDEIANKNIFMCRKMVLAILFCEIAYTIFALFTGGFKEKSEYIILYAIMFVISLVLLAIFKWNESVKKLKTGTITIAISVYAVLIIVWAVIISLFDTDIKNFNPFVIMTVMVMVTCIMTLDPKLMVTLQILGCLSFIFVNSIALRNGFKPIMTNMFVFLVEIVFIGQMMFSREYEGIIQRHRIYNQNTQLTKYNKTLTEYNKMLEVMSNTDVLTGASNRLAYNRDSVAMFESCIEKRKSMSCAIFDIDDFKMVNDTYGHLAGDECLIEIIKLFNSTWPYKKIYRVGGEEFCIITDTDNGEFLKILDNYRETISVNYFSSKNINLTISVGVYCEYPTESKSVDKFFNYADRALYKAKSLGKNRVEFSERSNQKFKVN